MSMLNFETGDAYICTCIPRFSVSRSTLVGPVLIVPRVQNRTCGLGEDVEWSFGEDSGTKDQTELAHSNALSGTGLRFALLILYVSNPGLDKVPGIGPCQLRMAIDDHLLGSATHPGKGHLDKRERLSICYKGWAGTSRVCALMAG